MFTSKGLSEGFSQLNKALAHFEAMDPNIEWFARIEQIIYDAISPYHVIYNKKKTDDSDKVNQVYESRISSR